MVNPIKFNGECYSILHPMRIGDRIRVIEKDYNFVGEVTDITGFFVFMRTDNGENITLPTSFVLQRGIEILEKE